MVKQDLNSAFRLNLQPTTSRGVSPIVERAHCTPTANRAGEADFARWLAAYFRSDPAGYWTKVLETRDPEGLYHRNDDWQAWTWEVRFSRGPSVLEAERWAADPASHSELRQALGRVHLAPNPEFKVI